MTDATQPQAEVPKAAPQAAEDDPLRDLHERLGPQLEQAQAQLSELNERVKTFIKKNPGSTLLGAAALGFLVGKLASRR